MTPSERYLKLKEHISEENPILLKVINQYATLDKVAQDLGFLDKEDSYTANISWWPLISILGTFSAGKSSFINNYLGEKIQQSGNQAVDDKFTVISYGENEKPQTLPGLALDADPRFPFYNISSEVEKVEEGEGNRVNKYLQLKIVKNEALKGKIFIDSPGFDADSQRDLILRITSHIIDMSDLVLIFFDARHPEPGAMRDTLEHLVGTTVRHRDANKILYILNQIDTSANDDNLEDIIGSWQRALSQKGLVSGNFFTIYNENVAIPIADDEVAKRLKRKKDEDMEKILERIEDVQIDRAYRISKSLEDFAKDIKDTKLPKLREVLKEWAKKVLFADITMIVLFLLVGVGVFSLGILEANSKNIAIYGVVSLVVYLYLHFKIRNVFAVNLMDKYKKENFDISKAIAHNTKWYYSIFRVWGRRWIEKTDKKLEKIIEDSRSAIRKLNDQFVHTNRD